MAHARMEIFCTVTGIGNCALLTKRNTKCKIGLGVTQLHRCSMACFCMPLFLWVMLVHWEREKICAGFEKVPMDVSGQQA